MTDGRRVWVTLTLLFALTSLTGAARGEFKPRVSSGQIGEAAALLVNGRPAVRFRDPNGNLSPLERAQITNQRLSALVAAKLDPKTIYAAGDNWSAKVCAGDQVLCRVTRLDAKRQRVSAAMLLEFSWKLPLLAPTKPGSPEMLLASLPRAFHCDSVYSPPVQNHCERLGMFQQL